MLSKIIMSVLVSSTLFISSESMATTYGNLKISQSGCYNSAPTTSNQGTWPAEVGGQANANGSLYLNSVHFNINPSTTSNRYGSVLVQFYSDGSAYAYDTQGNYFSGGDGGVAGTWAGTFTINGTAWVVNAQVVAGNCTMRFVGTAYNGGF